MGLVGWEREGCKGVLRFLDNKGLRFLAKTVTSKRMTRQKEGIIEAILDHSQSAEELLKRRKVHCDSIFKYLISEGLSLPQRISKPDVIQKAIEHWRGTVSNSSQSSDHQMGQVPRMMSEEGHRGQDPNEVTVKIKLTKHPLRIISTSVGPNLPGSPPGSPSRVLDAGINAAATI
ncbi:uncharacterized protein C3orf38-like [Mixophyes fleayi]|uniref:uncharacterized protein C3orf38-like n=1 Tax=Mixophyes fleayi TaxID=3061075 RepID=UPI003F4D958C